MSQNEHEQDLPRRTVGALLGGLAAAVGYTALGGCAHAQAPAAGPQAPAPLPLPLPVNPTDVRSVPTVLGAGPPHLRTGVLAQNTGVELGASVAIAEGCVTPGDGGGGVFYYDPASTLEDDGGTVIRPTSTPPTAPGRWIRIFSGALSVKWFGARGDGTTADDVAIQNAIDAAAWEDNSKPAKAGAGVVFFPAGHYLLSKSLSIVAGKTATQSNIVLQGANGGASGQYPRSILKWNGDAQAPMLKMWSRDNVVEHLGFFVPLGKECLCAIDDTQAPGGMANTNNTYRHLRIGTDAQGKLTYGIKLADRADGSGYPANVDNHRFEACYFDLRGPGGTKGIACVFCPNKGGQSKHHLFVHCDFTNAQYAIHFTSGSFHTQSCAFGMIEKTAIFIIMTTDTILIEFSDVEHCPQFFKGGGSSSVWPVLFVGGRYDVSDPEHDYADYISVAAGGPLILMGLLFSPPGQIGADKFSVSCRTVSTDGAGGTLVAIGCAFPNTMASTPFPTSMGHQQRIIGLGNHRYTTKAGTYIAAFDDQFVSVNSGDRLRVAEGDLANDTCGAATIAGAETAAAVSFRAPEPDVGYGVLCSVESAGPSTTVSTPYVSGKTPTGFTIHVPQAPGGRVTISWMLVRNARLRTPR